MKNQEKIKERSMQFQSEGVVDFACVVCISDFELFFSQSSKMTVFLSVFFVFKQDKHWTDRWILEELFGVLVN